MGQPLATTLSPLSPHLLPSSNPHHYLNIYILHDASPPFIFVLLAVCPHNVSPNKLRVRFFDRSLDCSYPPSEICPPFALQRGPISPCPSPNITCPSVVQSQTLPHPPPWWPLISFTCRCDQKTPTRYLRKPTNLPKVSFAKGGPTCSLPLSYFLNSPFGDKMEVGLPCKELLRHACSLYILGF